MFSAIRPRRVSKVFAAVAAVSAIPSCAVIALHHPCNAGSLTSCPRGVAALVVALLGATMTFRVAAVRRTAESQPAAPAPEVGPGALSRFRHDLRNRVNVVQAYAELLGRSQSLDDKNRRYAEKLRAGMVALTAAIESSESKPNTTAEREKCA